METWPGPRKLTYGALPEAERNLEQAQERLGDRQSGGQLLKEEVTEEDIARVVASWTGIPVTRLKEGERCKLVKMEERLGERVIGQQTAVEAVSNAVRRARAGLQDENRPIGSFLFLGPTGVGKTELSKALAEFLFDDEGSHGADRHVGVYGEAQCGPSDRGSSGLRGL